MSSENDLRSGLLRKVRESATGRIDEAFAEGYSKAADICTGALAKRIEDLLNQIQSGQYLSDQEQFLLSSLVAVRSDVESALRDFWKSTGSE